MEMALIAAPDAFEELLGDLPENVILATRFTPKTGLALCFTRSLKDLTATLDLLAAFGYPNKRPSGSSTPKAPASIVSTSTRTTSAITRSLSGLVDYKVCSIDKDWSALNSHGASNQHAKPPVPIVSAA